MSLFNIPPVENIVLFGGGALLVEFARTAKLLGMETTVFAVKRHLEEIIDTVCESSLEVVLEREDIPYYLSQDLNRDSTLQTLVNERTIGIGLGEAYTFTTDTIQRFQGRLFDFMTIRLPQYRGGAHFTWQILRQSRIGCWNIQLINEEMIPGGYDSGAILKTHEFVIPQWARTPADYFKVYNAEALKLFREFIEAAQKGCSFPLFHLQEQFSLYLPRLHTLTQAWLDWSWTSDEMERFICAFDDPYAGASTMVKGERVFLKKCQRDPTEGGFHPFMSGLIYRIHSDAVFVALKDGGLIVRQVLNERGEDLISWFKVGQRFYTPIGKLEEALRFSAEYDAEGLVSAGSLAIT